LDAVTKRRAALDLPPLVAKEANDFEDEQKKALEKRGTRLWLAVQADLSSEEHSETYDAWRQRVTTAVQGAGPAAQNEFFEKAQKKYQLTAGQVDQLKASGAGMFYDKLPVPEKVDNAPKKKLYGVQNDREFGSEAGTVALEFGFITLKEGGGVTIGTHAVQNTKAWLEHAKAVAAEVKKAYPEFCPGDPPKVYRLAILTHGAVTWGLKFVAPEAPEIARWFRIENLDDQDGSEFLDGLAQCLAPAPVIALYACNTGGNAESLSFLEMAEAKRIQNQLVKENRASLEKELAKISATAPDRKALRKKIEAEHRDRLQKALKKAKDDLIRAKPKTEYEKRLVGYGGNPATGGPYTNTVGKKSFAHALRDHLRARSIAADVWAHTDAGHTSRNARLRLFHSNGKTSDLVRLVFEGTADFKSNDQPSQKQFDWWWHRGDEKVSLPPHQHAIKKAALCAAASLNDDQRAFSLKALIANFNKWYPG
jgi:hypothetical protein